MTTKVYAAEGATIRKLPTETPTENGVKISIGFPVCTLTEWCDDQAEAVAEIMNRGEAFEANQARIAVLEKALKSALEAVNKAGGVALGVAMSGRNHPNPDGALMDVFQTCQAVSGAAAAALSPQP